MVYALVLLGLVPVMFFPEVFGGEAEDAYGEPVAANGGGEGDFLDDYASDRGADPDISPRSVWEDPYADPPVADPGAVIGPDIQDDVPVVGDEIDPATVLSPDEADETPQIGEEIDPDTVLSPDTEDDMPPATPRDARVACAQDLARGGAETLLSQVLGKTEFPVGETQMTDKNLGDLNSDDESGATGNAEYVDAFADAPLEGQPQSEDLMVDRSDAATGGEGSDVFWLYFDDVSQPGHAEVNTFIPGEDFLRITLNPDLTHGDIRLDVSPSDNGEDGIVRVNGAVVALLKGAPDATTNDVVAEIREDVFPPPAGP